jgi:hypothetical protein
MKTFYFIDFIHLYKIYSGKDNLQGHHITINEVYEAETVEVSLTQNSLHPSMIMQRLRQLFGETRWQQDVFACVCIRDQNRADIELMNAESMFIYQNLMDSSPSLFSSSHSQMAIGSQSYRTGFISYHSSCG